MMAGRMRLTSPRYPQPASRWEDPHVGTGTGVMGSCMTGALANIDVVGTGDDGFCGKDTHLGESADTVDEAGVDADDDTGVDSDDVTFMDEQWGEKTGSSVEQSSVNGDEDSLIGESMVGSLDRGSMDRESMDGGSMD